MTRIAVTLISLCFLSGVLFYVGPGLCAWFRDYDALLSCEVPIKDRLPERLETVFYLRRDLPAGADVTPDDLEKRDIPKSKIPQNAVRNRSMVLGRKAGFDLPMGQMLSLSDLVPYPLERLYEQK